MGTPLSVPTADFRHQRLVWHPKGREGVVYTSPENGALINHISLIIIRNLSTKRSMKPRIYSAAGQ